MYKAKPKYIKLKQLVNEYHGTDKNFSWLKYIQRCIKHKEYPLKTQPLKIQYLHNYIVKLFIKMVLTDIIDNNVQFDIDLKNKVLLSLLIADRSRKSVKYRYRIEKRGHDFYPYAITSPELYQKAKTFMKFRLELPWWRKVEKNIENGKEYEMAPNVNYKKKENGQQLYQPQGYNGENRSQV